MLFILQNRPQLVAEDFCAIYMQDYGCAYLSNFEWSVDIPEKIPLNNDKVKTCG